MAGKWGMDRGNQNLGTNTAGVNIVHLRDWLSILQGTSPFAEGAMRVHGPRHYWRSSLVAAVVRATGQILKIINRDEEKILWGV